MREEFGWLKYVVSHVQLKHLRESSLLPFIFAEHGKTDIQTPEPVSMSDTIVFVYTYWMFFGICCIAFCVEWAFKLCFKKVKVRVTRDALGKLKLKVHLAWIVRKIINSLYRFHPREFMKAFKGSCLKKL